MNCFAPMSYLTGSALWQLFKKAAIVALLFLLLLVIYGRGHAQETKSNPGVQEGKRLLVLPFPFFNDTIGTGLGTAVLAQGYVQPQMLTVGSGLFSVEGTYLAFLMVRNFQVPWLERLILDPQISSGKFEDINSYARNNPAFPNERAGSNDSSEGNFLESDGTDFWFEFKMKYLLSIGDGKDAVFPKLTLDNGILVSDDGLGELWNPFKSGRTYIELTPFYRNQDLSDDNGTVQKTAGIDVALEYDNTDFRLNPSGGSYQRVFYSRDWGGFDSTAPWTVLGGEAAKYIALGPSESARQRVPALNFWTVDCLTWASSHVENGQTVYHRPPTYKGANLGLICDGRTWLTMGMFHFFISKVLREKKPPGLVRIKSMTVARFCTFLILVLVFFAGGDGSA